MPPSDQSIDDLIAAILDGTPIDWSAAESSAGAERPLVRQLRLLASVADRFRGGRPTTSTPCEAASADATATTGEIPRMWGHLQLIERIGRGSFGEVYRAWDARLDREVALKLLPAGSPSVDPGASVLIHEGRLLARVRHPNVVTIYGAERVSDQIGLWMEFVRGQNLEQVLAERKTVPVIDVIDIGLELCRAVGAVHGAGVLHRDIKTHNVVRADDGRVVLMDFGAGRELNEGASADLAGTPLYLAPEVLSGEQATVQSDVYSLGILLYHLVTGSYPVYAQTVRGVRRAHEQGERIALRTVCRSVPRKLARVIERAIDPDPKRRYPSVDALSADLLALKRRFGVPRLVYAAGVAAAFTLVAAAGWELAGRQIGWPKPLSALVMDFARSTNSGLRANVRVEAPVIAVLPFKNLGAQPDTQYFVDGLTEEIIANLSVVQGVQVRSRASSFAFKDKPRNLQQIAERLGANLIVEGSVKHEGNRLRISARLVQVQGDMPLWADEFDRELNAIFSIHDEISQAVVNRLGLTFKSGPPRFVTTLEAYELYLQGHALVDRRGMDNARKAAELFEQVISRDPEFAPAHAGLAIAYAFNSFPYRGMPFETAYPIMRRAAPQALRYDSQLAEAHVAMGWVYSFEHNWDAAEKEFQTAIDRNPSLIQAYTSYSVSTLQPLEKYDEALRLLQIAARQDPLSLDVQREIGEVQLFSGRYTEAVETFQRVSAAEPDFPFIHSYLARALMLTGRVKEALPLLEPGVPYLALCYVRTGRRTEAERLAAEWERYPYRLAVISAALGDTTRTVAALERAAVSEPHRMGRLLIEPELVALRKDPRLSAIRKKFGLL